MAQAVLIKWLQQWPRLSDTDSDNLNRTPLDCVRYFRWRLPQTKACTGVDESNLTCSIWKRNRSRSSEFDTHNCWDEALISAVQMAHSKMKVRLRSLPALILALAAQMYASVPDADPEEKFVVYRASPNTLEQLSVIRELHDNMHIYDLDFWLTPTALGHKADIMIPENRKKWLEDYFSNHSIPHGVTIYDVQQLILDREHKRKPLDDFSKRLNDEGGNKAKYGLGEYHSYDHIISWMEDIQSYYPDKARVVNIGVTDEGRPIKGIKIGTGVHRNDKRVFWIDGGIHAREWAAVHTVIYIIDRLIADYDTDPLVHQAVDQLNFYIFPVLNPDGYEYSRSGVSPMIRLWRKNRSSMLCKKDQWFRERCCGGVDLNRNFDWFWGEVGSSSDRCSEIYQGKGPFSEAEARAVRDAMFSPDLRGKVDAFLTLHTYSQMWIHPFSHQRKTVPEDINDIEDVGRRAISALESVYGTKYRFGTGADILYPSSGGSDDWAKGKGGAKYVYLMELRPGEEVWDGFILDSRQLIPTGRETWAGIKVVIEAVLNLKRARHPRPTTTTPAPTTPATSAATTAFFPSSSGNPLRRRISRPLKPIFVPSEARQIAMNRLRQQQAELEAMRQRVRGERIMSRRIGPVVFDRPMSLQSVPSTCFDRSPWCAAWLERNPQVCLVSSIFMRRDCSRTCRFC
ncbi:unnamed protein product [Cylicocyclus nassatus]|uniref:ShKT domain-containing protein n=1 Tax=Cylicocyclus nassatus TaxID=53992 RepID=A0AA36GLE9_CYLNA|nr:unnamed protein product [Cylicocyclus nassatus]